MDNLPEFVKEVITASNGKTYYHVPCIFPYNEATVDYKVQYREEIAEYTHKGIECFGCPNNKTDRELSCEIFHGKPKNKGCGTTKDMIYISPYSYKRYIHLRVIQRLT